MINLLMAASVWVLVTIGPQTLEINYEIDDNKCIKRVYQQSILILEEEHTKEICEFFIEEHRNDNNSWVKE